MGEFWELVLSPDGLGDYMMLGILVVASPAWIPLALLGWVASATVRGLRRVLGRA